jgi:Na+/H+ antiporter NhaB
MHFIMTVDRVMVVHFLGVTSGWVGVTITTFFTIRSPQSLWSVLSLVQSSGLSGKVSEHVVTCTRVLVCYPNMSSIAMKVNPFLEEEKNP